MFGKRKRAAEDEQARFALAVQLRDVGFFDGFAPGELERVADLADEVEALPGAVIIDQGRVGQECFVVLAGQASVFVGDDLVATIGPGTMIGEMALVDHRPRSAFDTGDFATLLGEMPKVHERVLTTLAARLEANRARRQHDD
jgi:CRP-like cAMP-binding protein